MYDDSDNQFRMNNSDASIYYNSVLLSVIPRHLETYNQLSSERKQEFLEACISMWFNKPVEEIVKTIDIDSFLSSLRDDGGDIKMSYRFQCPCGLKGDDRKIFIEQI